MGNYLNNFSKDDMHRETKHMKKSVRERYTKTTTEHNFALVRMYMFKTTK